MCLSCFCRKPLLHLKSVVHDKPESSSSLPDPGDWDPNYSDELLLQDDSSELNNMTMGVCKLVKLLLLQNLLLELGDLIKCKLKYVNTEAKQAFPHADGSPDVYVHPMMRSSHLMPHFSQFAPSQLGQQ